MVDTVTPVNETLYRKQFAAIQGHSMECVEETVSTMGKMLANVCIKTGNIPIHEVMDQIGVEEFEKYLIQILEQKDCNCSKNFPLVQ